MSPDLAIWVFLTIFNLSVIVLLRVSLQNNPIPAALIDKDALTTAKTQALAASGVAAGNAAAILAAAAPAGAPAPVVNVAQPTLTSAEFTSSSRIAMMTGITVLASFLWALGNLVIYRSFGDISDVATLMKGVWPFFLAGSALFAPYAFNQLKGALP